MEGLTEGRIVHFVTEKGAHRPAIIVRVWRVRDMDGNEHPPDNGYSNLVVFMDGSNDGDQHIGCVNWQTSVEHSAEPRPRTWHWIEKA